LQNRRTSRAERITEKKSLTIKLFL